MRDGPARIDVHQHIVPPFYAEWLRENDPEQGMPRPSWSVEDALSFMDANGILTSFLSISTPGVHRGDDGEARRRARAVNEFAAEVVQANPERFGFFATLPLPDFAGAIAEAQHSLDVLHADGVVLLGNARGDYLGAPEHEPLFAELNERRAIVFVHPSTITGDGPPGLPAFAVDFLLDTTRAATNLVLRGVVQRYPELKIILSHAGGFLPYAGGRIATAVAFLSQRSITDVAADLRSFYFDTALSSATALPSLLAFAGADHVVFGSDWPFAPAPVATQFTCELDAYELSQRDHERINHGNARRILSRLGAAIRQGE